MVADVSRLQNTWPESHKGPVITYMAAVSGEFSAVAKEELNWFKIDASGLIDGTTQPGNWATDVLMTNNITSTVTIPSDIAAGNYVLRHEIIALHSAGQEDGAQSYPQCMWQLPRSAVKHSLTVVCRSQRCCHWFRHSQPLR